jgi:uncharacterized protein (TIGR02453 family)
MKNTISFLKKISKNNNTPWMHAHKDEYNVAKAEFAFLVQELIVRISSWDTRLPHLEVKDCVFRFNRDTRFSDNKNPYKENFGAYFAYGGKKGGLPGYYLHVSPKEIFVAAGIWMPEADKLLSIRRHILDQGDELEKILKDKKLKKDFLGLSTEHMLKRPPKGFPADHKNIELLKFKSFTISSPLSLEQVLSPGFAKVIDQRFKVLKTFNQFLLEATTNKPND